MKESLLLSVVLLSLIPASAEQYKLKLPVTVDIVEGGEVVGTKKLKAGTLLQLSDVSEVPLAEDAKESKGLAKKGSKLTPSKISAMMFKNTQPVSAVFRAKIELNDGYYGPFDGKDKMYWSICINAYDEKWEVAERLDGYVSKSSQVGKRLISVVKDGKMHGCHIKVKPVKYEDLKDYVTIEDFEMVDVPE